MQFLKKLKKLVVSASVVAAVAALSIPSTVAFAAEDVVRGQEIETPDSVQEAIAELQQDQSDQRLFDFPETYADISDSVNIAAYRDRNFTNRSAPEPLVLRKSCDTISLTATWMEEGVTDTIICHFEDYSYSGTYNFTLPFTADGSVTTIAWPLPEIEGRIYFTCNTPMKEGLVVFSRYE